jgi:hypothetical protein
VPRLLSRATRFDKPRFARQWNALVARREKDHGRLRRQRGRYLLYALRTISGGASVYRSLHGAIQLLGRDPNRLGAPAG